MASRGRSREAYEEGQQFVLEVSALPPLGLPPSAFAACGAAVVLVFHCGVGWIWPIFAVPWVPWVPCL